MGAVAQDPEVSVSQLKESENTIFIKQLTALEEAGLVFVYFKTEELQPGDRLRLSWRRNVEISAPPFTEDEDHAFAYADNSSENLILLTFKETTKEVEWRGGEALLLFDLDSLRHWTRGIPPTLSAFYEELSQKGWEGGNLSLNLSLSLIKLEKKTLFGWTPVKSLFYTGFGDNVFSQSLQELWDLVIPEDSALCLFNDSTVEGTAKRWFVKDAVFILRCDEPVLRLELLKINETACNDPFLFENSFMAVIFRKTCHADHNM